MRSGIYQIQNTVNGNKYIGSAVNLRKRWNLHKTELNSGKHHNQHMQHSWNKYGKDIFKFNPIIICSKDNLIMYEQLCLDNLYPEYNICRIAGSQLGIKRSEQWREKQKLRVHPCLGLRLSDAHKASLLAANLGRKNTLKSIAKMSAVKTGHIVLPETRKKIALALSGRKRPDLSVAQLGKKRRPPSDETKAKMSVSAKNRRKK